MSKRVFLSVIIALAIAPIAVATYVSAQRAAQRSGQQARKPAASQTAERRAQTAPGGPARKADPNRAPQARLDDALFTNEDFFGASASVARPYDVALERLSGLMAQYPKDARLHLSAARLAERLGQFDRASMEMAEYARLKNRAPDALRRLASFYHNRARFADEVRTLQELARAVPANQRPPVYKRAADVVRSHALSEFKPADFFAELVAADPNNIEPIKDYVQELALAEKNQDALAVLVSYQPRFPTETAYFLKTRAELLERMNDRRAAEAVYSDAFDATWPPSIVNDYYDLLRRVGRYRAVRRALQEQVKSGTRELQPVARLFHIYAHEGNYTQAAALLKDLEDRRAGAVTVSGPAQANLPAPVGSGSWSGAELQTVATMFSSVGHYDQASRYLYTLYLAGGLQPGTPAREDALYRLFRVMLEAAGAPTRVAAGDLSFYKDVAEVDQHPGFINGVLSLILSGTDPAQEFATQEKAAAGYYNRAFAHRIFTSFKQEYARSRYLADMYLGVINVFSSLGEHRLALQAGREFRELYPTSPRYGDVTLSMADSYVALKERANERLLLGELLDRLARQTPRGVPLVAVSGRAWSYGLTPVVEHLVDRIKYNIEAYSDTYDPTEGGDDTADAEGEEDLEDEYGPRPIMVDLNRQGPSYSSVLERYVSSLAADEKKTETVALFWGEIRKHPREEGLYERFLRWLGQSQIINEQLRAYTAAMREFDSNTWYHRLARWYVRQKRGRELSRYSRQLIDIFDEEEITDYLYRFAGYGTTASGDSLNWDEKFAYDLYTYAHNRFPRNLYFVRGRLTYLAKNDEQQWAELSARYYFADKSVREPYLAWLSKKNTLRARYDEARSKVPGIGGQGTGIALINPPASQPAPDPRSPAPGPYEVFAADAAIWLSRFEEGINAYRKLIALYPGEPQYGERLSDLTRSFGEQDARLYEESARGFAALAEIYPVKDEYRIKAGEVYAQLGDFKRAGEQWDRLIQIDPGKRDTYLEVATIYWDYYQYDQAVRVFKELRAMTNDPTIYAYRLGAVYEGKGDIDSAIAEYVNVLGEPGDGRDTVTRRLAQLSRRAGLAEKIAAAYQRAHAARPGDWQMVIGYAQYQAERDNQPEALSVLRAEVARSADVAFLESVRGLFRAILRPEDEQQVINRLTSAARDEREAMMYRLQQAAFLERQKKVDEAIAIIDRLVTDFPTNVGVIEESSQFYWRAGLLDRSIDLLKRTLARAEGPNRRILTFQLARKQAEADRLGDAEATLRAFYDGNRGDAEAFAELARVLGEQNKMTELASLYSQAFEDARKSGLTGDDAKARMVSLREGMIATLTALGKHTEAVDQHIEIINTLPEDADRLATAISYAERHNLIDRVVGYYEKLSRDSFKNYRWQLVLGRIYERRGNLPGASDQYRIAVTNEPQRSDIRFMLASALTRQRRYDEAIATLREGWALAGRDPSWLVEVAQIQVRQGKTAEAIATVRQAMAERKNAMLESEFEMAARLASWGLHAEAARIFGETFAKAPRVLKDQYIQPVMVSGYVKALMRVEPAAQAYQKIEQLRAQFQAIAGNSQDTDAYKARSIVEAIDTAMKSDFGRGVVDHATAGDIAALSALVQSSIAKLTLYSDIELLRRYLSIARGANLVAVEEQIHRRLMEAAFAERGRLLAIQNAARTDAERNTAMANVSAASAVYYGEIRAMLSFYERHAAYARAAEMLRGESARDPIRNGFDYQNQMAVAHRLAGDSGRELEALGAAYKGVSGNLVSGSVDWVGRYFELLHARGLRGELDSLASIKSPYQLQLINFLIEKGERELARKAIANAGQSAAWVASRSGEVGLFLKDTSAETESHFKRALGLRRIGEMLGRNAAAQGDLVGKDWFIASRNYGYWLGLSSDRQTESSNYVLGEIEGQPSSAEGQLELAAYYLDRKDADRASSHVALAAELAPGSNDVTVMRGRVLFARGDRAGAIQTWAGLMSGRPATGDAAAYIKVMADHGLLAEALPRLENYLVAYIARASRSDDETMSQGYKSLVRQIAARARADATLTSQAAALFEAVISRLPADISFGQLVIKENLLPEPAQSSIYRAVHARLSDMVAGLMGTSRVETGIYVGGDYIYPASALEDWRRRLLDYLIRNRSFDEARLLIDTIRQEMAESELALENSSDDSESYNERYQWLPLAAAGVELRAGSDMTKVMAELRGYCHLDGERELSEGYENTQRHDRCLKAYALLVAEGKPEEADALLYDAYRADVESRFINDASLAGLAEIEARRGRSAEATRLLRMLVERSTDNLDALRLAAETSARAGLYADAVEFRQQIAEANPSHAVNRLELARAMAAAGRSAEAIDRIATLMAERATANSVRAQAAEVVGDIVRADRSQAARAANLFSQRAAGEDRGGALARAAIAEAAGDPAGARAALAEVNSGPLAALARMKSGLAALAGGLDSEAIDSFEQALYLDADGLITDALAFRAQGPRQQLILLYSKTGRDLAAVRLSESDDPSRPSSLARAVRIAINFQNDPPPSGFAFEPSIIAAREKAGGLRSLAEMNEAAMTKSQDGLLAALVESAARLGQYDRAIAIERARAREARAEERAAIERRLGEIVAEDAARRAREETALRVTLDNTTGTIYAARVR